MKVLVLGASGMAGHKLVERLADRFEVVGSVRANIPPRLSRHEIIAGLHADSPETVEEAISRHRPDFVINAVGVVKQCISPVSDLVTANAWFPHRLASLCGKFQARLIQLSTDCVFSGNRGNYSEEDRPDPDDLYGMSKVLGEPNENMLTIRMSTFGRQLRDAHGLVEWLYSQRGKEIRGYKNAVFSGISTIQLSRFVEHILIHHPDLTGIWHVAAEPIDKCSFLELVNQLAGLGVGIRPDYGFHCNRSLNGNRLQIKTGFTFPAWEDMVREMVEDGMSYDS